MLRYGHAHCSACLHACMQISTEDAEAANEKAKEDRAKAATEKEKAERMRVEEERKLKEAEKDRLECQAAADKAAAVRQKESAANAQAQTAAYHARKEANQEEADATRRADAEAEKARETARQKAQEKAASDAAAEAARARENAALATKNAMRAKEDEACARERENKSKAKLAKLKHKILLAEQLKAERLTEEQRAVQRAEERRQAELMRKQAEVEFQEAFKMRGLMGLVPWKFLALIALILVFMFMATIASLHTISVLAPVSSVAHKGLLAVFLTVGLLWSLFSVCLVLVAKNRDGDDMESGQTNSKPPLHWWWDDRHDMPLLGRIAMTLASVLVASPVMYALLIPVIFLWDFFIGQWIGSRVGNLLPGMCTVRMAVIICYSMYAVTSLIGFGLSLKAIDDSTCDCPMTYVSNSSSDCTCPEAASHQAATAACACFIISLILIIGLMWSHWDNQFRYAIFDFSSPPDSVPRPCDGPSGTQVSPTSNVS